jgi:hypothetical protein
MIGLLAERFGATDISKRLSTGLHIYVECRWLCQLPSLHLRVPPCVRQPGYSFCLIPAWPLRFWGLAAR